MPKTRTLHSILLGGMIAATGCYATGTFGKPDVAQPPMVAPTTLNLPPAPASAVSSDLPAAPIMQPGEKPLPINLPTALQLANVRAVDVAAAAERIQIAVAVLEQAEVLWLPTITVGGDYARHDGKQQDTAGNVFDNSRSSLMFGLGTGIGTAAILHVGDAIFAPLAARQQVRARESDKQAASNDTMLAVSDSYFNVQQVRGIGGSDRSHPTHTRISKPHEKIGSGTRTRV